MNAPLSTIPGDEGDGLDLLRDPAFIDAVTGLPNRRRLLALIDAELEGVAVQTPQPCLCLLVLQVPQVAELNDRLGLGAANGLAAALTVRLQSQRERCVCIGHLGGGEFAVLLKAHGSADTGAVLRELEQWQAALEAPVSLDRWTVHPQCRTGVALFPADGKRAEDLLVSAQAACHAGAVGGSPVRFEPANQSQALRALQLEAGLQQALHAGEFILAYQPRAALKSGQVASAKACLIWQSAKWGEVPGAEFIPLAERSGLIVSIGRWMIQEACQQIKRWREAGLPNLRVAVSLSPVQVQLMDVASVVHCALAENGIEPAALVLEVAEQSFRRGGGRACAVFSALRARGVGVTLGDFAAGVSNLNSLRDLPVNQVILDRSVTSDLTASPHSASVTRSIIQLAHALRISVLADGVETEGQLQMLLAAGCDAIQGEIFSAPMTADRLAALLAEDRRLALPAPAVPQRRRHLLLVDDEAHILSALKRLFRRDGYTLLTAQSGAEGLELLTQHPVDVILSDQRMPGMTGVEFLRLAKDHHPETVRMTLSGFTDLQSIIDAVNEGAVYKFLTKPWDDELLRGHVSLAFAQKEMADENRRLQAELASASAQQSAVNERLSELLAQSTEQSQLIQAGAGNLHALIDALPVGVVGVDDKGLMAFANTQAIRLLPNLQGGLGESALPALGSLLAALKERPEMGLQVPGSPQPMRAWLGRLPSRGAACGDVLVFAPDGEGR